MSFQVVFRRAVFRNLAQSQSLSHWPTAWTRLWIFSKLWPKELEATCKLPTWNLAELSSPQGLQIIYCSSWKDSSLIQSMFTEPVSSCNMHMCSVASSCLTLSLHPVDCGLPGSSVHGILQAGMPGWVPMPSSRGAFWPRDCPHVSCDSCMAGRRFATEPPGQPML